MAYFESIAVSLINRMGFYTQNCVIGFQLVADQCFDVNLKLIYLKYKQITINYYNFVN